MNLNTEQTNLRKWQIEQFPNDKYYALSKEELIEIINKLQMALGICEEAGEIAHFVLKDSQGIREGTDKEKVVDEIGDGYADVNIYGMQLLSLYKIKAQSTLRKTIDKILNRNWLSDPEGKNIDHNYE